MTKYDYEITAAWPSRPKAASVVGRTFLQTLASLERIDPIFQKWGTGKSSDYAEHTDLENYRNNFTAFVEANVYRDDWDRPTPEDGYFLWAKTNGYPRFDSDGIKLNFAVHAGSSYKNNFSFDVSEDPGPLDLAVITYPLFKSVFLTLISIWRPPWANTKCSIWGEPIPQLAGEPPFPYSGYQMPWISYLCAERAAQIDVPKAILTEHTPDGGLLMIAAESRFDPTDRDQMRRSRLMAEIMIAHGGNPGY